MLNRVTTERHGRLPVLPWGILSWAVSSAALATLLSFSPDAGADDAVQATLRCAPRVGRGRVLCDVDMTVKSGRLTWADAIIIETPSFAAALRDRVGMRNASERSAQHMRLPFALLARASGKGQVTIKARVVWCKATPRSGQGGSSVNELCLSATSTASAEVIVTEPSD